MTPPSHPAPDATPTQPARPAPGTHQNPCPLAELDVYRNPFGLLVLRVRNTEHVGVQPVRAFPLAAPEEGISLVSAQGVELYWLERLADLPDEAASLLREILGQRAFTPEIVRIEGVSSVVTPCTWTVETAVGTARFELASEESIRRLTEQTLLIADSRGLQFLIRDMAQLDAHSRRILDRFL